MNKVTVLLSTYNGEKYLNEQLDSILNQKDVSVSILVRDDGSSDNTISILNDYKSKGLLEWYTGNNKKSALSFMDLIDNAPQSDYYAFCDQDDFWLPDKLKIAIEKLETFNKYKPSLYFGKPRIADSNLNVFSSNARWYEISKFEESFICSCATGCTEVFNYSLFTLLKGRTVSNNIIMHDAWIHKVCLLFDGNIFYDKDVHMLYRQHENNVIGANSSFFEKIRRHFTSLFSDKNTRSKCMMELYNVYCNDIDDYGKKELLLSVFDYNKNIIKKIKLLFNFKIRTKYFIRNLFFKLSVLLNTY